MELRPRDLRVLFPILRRYERLVGSLEVMCKFFPYGDA